MKTQALMFMSEIKFDLTLKKKIKFSASFMLLFTIIKLLRTLRLSRQKTNFFPSHFASIWSCSECLGGIILGKNVVLYLEIGTKKMPQSVIVSLTSRENKIVTSAQ